MRSVHAVLAVLAVCGAAVAAQAADKVYVAADVPAEVQVSLTVKRLAVVEFTAKDSGSQPYAGIAAGRLNSVLASAPGARYEMVDRTHLKGVLAEQDLGAAGVTDSNTAIKAGKMLNVDAIIFGSVHAERSEEMVTKPRIPMPGPISGIGGGSETRRSALVNVSFNMVQPESGVLITTKSVSRSYDSSKAGGNLFKKVTGGGQAPSAEAIVNDLIEQCVAEFAGLVSPHADVCEVQLASSRNTKVGTTFATGGDWEAAAKQYQAAFEKNPKDHAVVFDLAVARLMLNDPKAAVDLLDKAIMLKQDKKYIEIKWKVTQLAKVEGVQFRPATRGEASAFKGNLKD